MAINRTKVEANAQKYVRRGNWDKALREYLALVDDDPSDVRSLLKCADLYVKLDKSREALDAYRKVADHYAREDMYEKAVAVYKQALRLEERVDLHQALGEAYYRLGRLKDAVRSFHHAHRMYREAGDAERQRQILEYMVRIDPEDIGLRIQLAERYAKDGLMSEAVELFVYSAAILEEEGRQDEFVQVAERVIFLDPEQHDLRKKVIQIYLDRGDNKQALKHLQIVFRSLPTDAQVMELLALTFERLERSDKAVLVYEELAALHAHNGRTSQMEETYQRILRLDPGHARAQRALNLGDQARRPTRPTGLRAPSVDDSDTMSAPLDTGNIRPPRETPLKQDALAGVEFLDDVPLVAVPADDPTTVARGPQDPTLTAPARGASSSQPAPGVYVIDEAELVDISDAIEFIVPDESDDALLELDEESMLFDVPSEPVAPAAPRAAAPRAAAPRAAAPHSGAGPLHELSEEEVRQLLTECQVFLKYGLYSNADALISGVLARAPHSVVAHEQMLALHEAMRNREGMLAQLLELARLTHPYYPARAHGYLTRAASVAPDPGPIRREAREMGLDLDAPPPIDDLVEISADALEIVGGAQPLEEGAVAFLYDDEPATTASPAADETYAEEIEATSPHESTEPEALELGNLELSDFDDLELGDFAGLGDVPGLEASLPPVDSAVVDDAELSFGEDDEFVDVDIDELPAFDEEELVALEHFDDDHAGAIDLALTAREADEIFDNLFGDITHTSDNIFGNSASLEDSSDAEHHHSGLSVDRSPFGSKSLSQKFVSPLYSGQTGVGIGAPGASAGLFSDVMNSNLELGTAYRDMGLYEEAIEEFRQAADDPQAALQARYNIALCEVDLGRIDDARNTLLELLGEDELPAPLRHSASQKLATLG